MDNRGFRADIEHSRKIFADVINDLYTVEDAIGPWFDAVPELNTGRWYVSVYVGGVSVYLHCDSPEDIVNQFATASGLTFETAFNPHRGYMIAESPVRIPRPNGNSEIELKVTFLWSEVPGHTIECVSKGTPSTDALYVLQRNPDADASGTAASA